MDPGLRRDDMFFSMSIVNRQSSIRVLGLDPGYARCGWGVVDYSGDTTYVAHGCFETHKDEKFENRLKIIGEALEKVIEEYKPDRIAIEELFFAKSTTTALKVCHARGVLFFIAAKFGIPIDEMKPSQVKQGLTGYGKADKSQMQMMVKLQLKLQTVPQPDDAADALAVAIVGAVCHRTLALPT